MKRIWIVLLIIVILCLASVGAFTARYVLMHYGRSINQSNVYFMLKKDLSLEQAAQQLQEKKIIKSWKFLTFYAKAFKLNEGSLPGGNFIIKSNTSLKDLILKLREGKSDFAIVTIPEGYTLSQIGEKLEKNNLVSRELFLKESLDLLDSEKLIKPAEEVFYNMEGYLFPDTYYIPYTSTADQIAGIMFGTFTRVLSEKHRQRAKELGLSINEIVTIASLIEKEAANDEERSRISGVIYNRLKKGMLLQIDAAVIYANTKGEKNISVVTNSHLKFDSKYNTYKYKGLPPGPIASPGKPSIEAALYPETHDFLYYVLAGKSHVFSKTYEEHAANVKKYLNR